MERLKFICASCQSAFMNLTMRSKLLLFCSVLVLSSTTFLTIVVYNYTSDAIMQQAQLYSNEIVEQAGSFLDEKLRSILMQLNHLLLDERFTGVMKRLNESRESPTAYEISSISGLMVQMKNNDDLIDSIYVYADGYDFYNFNSVTVPNLDFTATQLYAEIQGASTIQWGRGGRNEIFRGGNEVVPVVVPINIQGRGIRGQYTVVNLNANVLRRRLDNIARNLESVVFIVGGDGQIVLADSRVEDLSYITALLEGDREQNAKNMDVQLTLLPLSINDWSIGVIQENRILLREVNRLGSLMIIIVIFFIIAFALVIDRLTLVITRPLAKLQSLMEQSPASNFTLQFNAMYRDEVGSLGMGFDNMCRQINELMECVMEEQTQKRTAELKALNAQINPHFLYNTLDCIYWTSLKNGDKVVADIALNISTLFRLGLNKGLEMTTVENELRHVSSYLNVQSKIYKGKFEYNTSCDDSLRQCPVVKLMLQPLAENCLLHAFRDMEYGGVISIDVFRREGFIVFTVTDNGCGIKDEVSTTTGSGYALENIRDRLRLYYHGQAGIRHYPAPGGGTTVEIYIAKAVESCTQ